MSRATPQTLTPVSPLASLRRAGTGPVSDALDRLGRNGGLAGLVRMSGHGVVAGPAFTLRFDLVRPGEPAPAAEFVDDVPKGAVVVIATGGCTTCTVWGDILAYVACRRGIAGTVIDGYCRDIDDIRALDYPLWSLGAYMKSGKGRVRLTATGQPVTLGGTTVHPGDLVCADGAGVVVVPAGQAEEVGRWVAQIEKMEQAIRADLDTGSSLRDARRRHGYGSAALRTDGRRPA